MDKLGIKKQAKFCYSVLEKKPTSFLKKVQSLNNTRRAIIELRLDYLLSEGLKIEEVINLVNQAKVISNKKIIATIRTIGEGGRVDLTKEMYFYYIKMLQLKTKIQAIDVEYKFYKLDKVFYDKLFNRRKKDIIISMHIFDKIFCNSDYNSIFKELLNVSSNIIKFAMTVYSKEDLFNFMLSARKYSNIYKKNKKESIFIAMGNVGKLSRVWHEFTNTKVIFINSYESKDDMLGNFDRQSYYKYRKLLEKKTKN